MGGIKDFHDNWDINADDFKTVYDKSFNSKDSNNLWANPHWFPKAVMLRFIDYKKKWFGNVSRPFNEPKKLISALNDLFTIAIFYSRRYMISTRA